MKIVENFLSSYFIISMINFILNINESKTYVLCTEASQRDEFELFSKAKKLVPGLNECLLGENETNFLKSILSPTILVATALEKFKFYSSQGDKKTKLKSYSILFQIKKILKYEHLVLNDLNASFINNQNKKSLKELYYISSQDEYSMEVNLNSFLMIENFNDNGSACNSIDIKLNKNYVLFLSAQNKSISLEGRRYFSYPIRLSILQKQSNIYKTRHKRFNFNPTVRSSSSNRLDSRTSVFVRMPIFSIFSKPLMYEPKLENEISNLTDRNYTQVSLVATSSQVILNQNVTIECKIFGQNLTDIHWKMPSLKHDNQKVNIHFDTNSSKSLMTIQNFTTNDQGTYYCFTYIYDNGDIFSERVIYDQVNLKANLDDNIKKTTLISTITTSIISNNNDNSSNNYNINNKNRISKIFSTFKSSTKKFTIKSSNNKHITKTTKKLLPVITTTVVMKESKFLNCSPSENYCQNGGQCFKTNPQYYKDNIDLYNILKTKFCVCKEYFQGPLCEFELSRKKSAYAIPDDLKPLWDSLALNKTS